MKFGLRTPSLKKMIKARTTSKWKRQIKKAVIPGYGKKGIGLFRNPKKAVYNKVYRKTSFDIFKLLGLKWFSRDYKGGVPLKCWYYAINNDN